MDMKIILSTRNASKVEQIGALFSGTPFTVVSLKDAGIEGKVVEDGETLEANGLKKALFAWEKSGHTWSMSDDSGIFIDALNGFPGVHAADWMGEDAPTDSIMRGILEKMNGIEDRTATFKCLATLVSPSGSAQTFLGEVRGVLLSEPRGLPQTNMPYSSIFIPDGQTKPWSQMSPEEENKISHRGKAFRQLRAYLESLSV